VTRRLLLVGSVAVALSLASAASASAAGQRRCADVTSGPDRITDVRAVGIRCKRARALLAQIARIWADGSVRINHGGFSWQITVQSQSRASIVGLDGPRSIRALYVAA
jgi:hypothetical protein